MKNPDKPNFMREWRRMWGYSLESAARELGLGLQELVQIEGGSIVPGSEILELMADLYLTKAANLYSRNPLNTPIGREMTLKNRWHIDGEPLVAPSDFSAGDGSRVQSYRKAAGLSQEELAEKIGAHTITISRLERGKMKLNQDWRERIAAALGVNPRELA